jgi:CRP/FNR family transcriptional regulator, dissimilatory nitrate respiration regulator
MNSELKQRFSALQAAATSRTFTAGQFLFHKGEPATAIFSVISGRVKLVRYLADGLQVTLQVARAGESFGEAALFSEAYHCDAVADIPTKIAIYPKQAVLQLLQDSPESALEFIALLTKQVQLLRSQLELRNIHSARDRTWQYLLLLIEPGQTAISFDRPLKDIASDIGLTHEAFYRTLAQLEAEGYLTRCKRQIQLLR